MRSESSLHTPFARLGAWVARRAPLVLAFSIAALVAGGLYGASVEEHLPAGGLEVPNSESSRAAEEAAHRFGIGSADVLVLFRNPDGPVRDPIFGTQVLDVLEPVLA